MMTKAKKRTAKVWTIQDMNGAVKSVWMSESKARNWLLFSETIVPATLTWSEPAPKAKKRSAR